MVLTDDQKKPPSATRPSAAPEGPSIGRILGTLALAVGVGVLGYYALDGHSHTCEGCGHKWRHLGIFNVGDPKAHACQRCGTVQWWKDGVPHVFREALRSPPPNALPDTVASRLREFRDAPRLAVSSATAVAWPLEVLR